MSDQAGQQWPEDQGSDEAAGKPPGLGFVRSIRDRVIDLQPTQRKFTAAEWKGAFDQARSDDLEDERLYQSGLFYFAQLQRALASFNALAPIGLVPESHVRLLTAAANLIAADDEARHWKQVKVTAGTSGPTGRAMHGPTMQGVTAALAARTVQLIDGLRHVLPEAAFGSGTRDGDPAADDADDVVLSRIFTELSLGRLYDALQTGWQECLWSDYYVEELEGEGVPVADVMLPGDLAREQDRAIGNYRRDGLLAEFGIRAAAAWPRLAPALREAIVPDKVVRAVEADGPLLRPVLGSRAEDLRSQPHTLIARGIAGEPYLQALLQEPLPKFGGLTPEQLLDTWELIATLEEVLSSRLPDPLHDPIRSVADLEHWAPLVSKAALEEAVREAVGLTANQATMAVGVFELPMHPRTDPWTRPLVPVGDAAVALLFNPLKNANLIRSIESWLEEGGLPLKRRGTLFEAALREELAEQVELPNAEVIRRSVVVCGGDQEEEIDLVIRIGCTFLISEVKCSVYPVDPHGFFTYERTLASAADQARRKAAFCQQHPEDFLAQVGRSCSPGDIRVLPLVVSNLPLGVGRRFLGVPVADLFILSRYLDGGQNYVREAITSPEGFEALEPVSFYRWPAEAEENLWTYLWNPPQLRDPRAWVTTGIGIMVPPDLLERPLMRVDVHVKPPSPQPSRPASVGVHGVAAASEITAPTPARMAPPTPSFGARNAPCSCGSGKKRKRCCG